MYVHMYVLVNTQIPKYSFLIKNKPKHKRTLQPSHIKAKAK